MHPILGSKERLRLYLAAWVPVAILLTALLGQPGRRGWSEAAALAAPMALVYAFVCISSWFVVRTVPLGRTGGARIAGSLLLACTVSSALWTGLGVIWASALGAQGLFPQAAVRYRDDTAVIFAFGFLVFLLASALHYLLIAFETTREAERRRLEVEVLAREAQLRSLQAQVNPHFLFNSLNAIASLAGSDPAGARTMCLLLADFLRRSLAAGAKAEIPFSEELSLVEGYLAIERVRFGPRLRVEEKIEDGVAAAAVPPLLLQPLVENAVKHGISGLVEGGTVHLAARVRAGRIEIEAENPCDPGRRRGTGTGLGIGNVRLRLDAIHGAAARVDVEDAASIFRIQLSFPFAQTEKVNGP